MTFMKSKKRAQTSASKCKIDGDGLRTATVRQMAAFTITACNEEGEQCSEGGDTFFVSLRGAGRTRAKIVDNEDGTYSVEYKPNVSGSYALSISLFGEALPGSPFKIEAATPGPVAANCELRGDALTRATARASHTFEVRFRDAWGHVAHAEELDVYVVSTQPKSSGTVSSRSARGSSSMETKPEGTSAPIIDDRDEGAQGTASASSEPTPPVGRRQSLAKLNMKDEASMEDAPDSAEMLIGPPSFLRMRVEVGSKPLVMRTACDLDTEPIGQLQPGLRMIVLEERWNDMGDLRARVSPIDDEEGLHLVREPPRRPRDEQPDELPDSLLPTRAQYSRPFARSILPPGRIQAGF